MRKEAETTDKRGITKVEALVILTLIALLILLLWPASTSTPPRSIQRLRECQQNLASLQKVIILYMTDHNNELPVISHEEKWPLYQGSYALTWGGGSIDAPYMTDTNRPLFAYIPDIELFHCPADQGGTGIITGDTTNVFATLGNSYGYAITNIPYTDISGLHSDFETPRKFLDPVNHPASKKVVLFEPTLIADPSGFTKRDQWHGKKQRAGNATFLDGHVEKLIVPEQYTPGSLYH